LEYQKKKKMRSAFIHTYTEPEMRGRSVTRPVEHAISQDASFNETVRTFAARVRHRSRSVGKAFSTPGTSSKGSDSKKGSEGQGKPSMRGWW